MLQSFEEVFSSRDFVDERIMIGEYRRCYDMLACKAVEVLEMFCILLKQKGRYRKREEIERVLSLL